MKKVLVISWYFPPINSSEGLVTYKLLNNSKFSYDVFTQKNNESWAYSKEDYLPIKDNINVIYSKANDLSSFRDDAVDYYISMMNNYDIVMTRSMPEECHMAGLEIKKINPNVKWISSFGDPIGNNPFTLISLMNNNPYLSSLNSSFKWKFSLKRIIKNLLFKRSNKKVYNMYIKSKNILEKNILDVADYVICNNKYEVDYLCENNKISNSDKFVIFPHTYDKELYHKVRKSNDKIIFSYLGHLDDIRTPRLLFEAINELKKLDYNLSSLVHFDFYGNLSDSDKLYLLNNDLLDIVHIKKSVKYLESLKIMKNSDWLIHIDANIHKLLDHNIFFAAKIADYIGSGNNIFGITMLDGACADILRNYNSLILSYSKNDIINYLYLIIYKNFKVVQNNDYSNLFDAKVVARDFDKLLETIVKEVK